jgi:hypothetical protein
MRERTEIDSLKRNVEDVILRSVVQRKRESLTADEAARLSTDAFNILAHGFYWDSQDARSEAAELTRVHDAMEKLSEAVHALSKPAQNALRVEYVLGSMRADLPFKTAKDEGDPSGLLAAVRQLAGTYSEPLRDAQDRLLRRDRILIRRPVGRGGDFDVQARFVATAAERIWKKWGRGHPKYGRGVHDRVDGRKQTVPNSDFTWFLRDLFECLGIRIGWHTVANARGRKSKRRR